MDQAIQHAHQKRIIHRDIKPSNILVTISEPGSPGWLSLSNFTDVSDLSPLRGLPLRTLDLSGTAVRELASLSDIPTLVVLDLGQTLVTNLSPLAQLPLEVLFFNNTKVRDVSPLLSIRTLPEIFLPSGVTNVAVLRALPGLQRISY